MNINSKLCHEGHQLYRHIHQRKVSVESVQAAHSNRRAVSSAAAVIAPRRHEVPKVPYGREAQQREADREFFTDLLSSAATKRDAKAYLARLQTPAPQQNQQKHTSGSYVNVGNLFRGSRAAEMSPTFTQGPSKETELQNGETNHIALVKLRDVGTISKETLNGIAETLVQLNRLSLSPCVVIDTADQSRQKISAQLDLLVDAINKFGNIARRVDNVFCTNNQGQTQVDQRKLLLRPLQREHIPVVAPVAFNQDEQRMVTISASTAMLALTRELGGLNLTSQNNSDTRPLSLDRVITIDAAGGIPNAKAADGRHVFLNLDQEYKYVHDHLDASSVHFENLNLLNQILRLLPPSSSGLMTTHAEAANHGRQLDSSNSVGTRRQKNALIHNLLTDKPAYSSSLPLGRLGTDSPTPSHTSFVKRGMPLTLLPNPFTDPWLPTGPRLQLTDPRINLPRLVHLIEDSFNRRLDVEHYLSRVNNRIAGVIIAGDYEGGAILTWESPPNGPPVPYLDKFAVLKRSQGAGGVADIVFNAMVRSCFPDGVCWRSRRNNPVNKWYFERSRGTWKVDDHWCMFWTGEGVETDSTRFGQYVSVCRGVQPSWADRKKPAD